MGHIFLSFTGALVFVSRYEVESHPERNEMRVLLAETRPSPSESHSSHKEDEIHLPRLVCPEVSVVPGPDTRSPDQIFGDLAIFYLDDQDLFLLKKRESLGVTMEEISGCPTQGNVCSFSWVAPLSSVDPGSEFIKPECFEKLNPDSSVIARVAITEGLIHTHMVASEPGPDGKVIQWVFRPVDDRTEPGPNEQALARAISDSVMYEADFDGDIIELRTRLFRQTNQREIRDIYPQGVGSERSIRLRVSEGTVHASVKNMALPDILGTREPDPVRGDDVHFAKVYGMSRQAPKRSVPHPVGHCDSSVPKICETTPAPHNSFAGFFHHNGNPNCPPPKAAAFSDAKAWDFELP